jgi:hypothetical protein
MMRHQFGRLGTDCGVNWRNWTFGVAVAYRDPRRLGSVLALGMSLGPAWMWLDFMAHTPGEIGGKTNEEIPEARQ